ncbi:hypothetical protein LOTGIDRAFT_164506 [Lottia gigantea]|uniref:Uncharacterized protein n=1 Tax=Lottia gigantea TaxID=225164 RepID=V4A597_LOTGI|nr:hypothetical protein LOTGIDRAFT_164506 [Lottia gigantea]ESO90190.1 hypothetical protein LOTGIDRAFT_164506 [Lottia gigantea]
MTKFEKQMDCPIDEYKNYIESANKKTYVLIFDKIMIILMVEIVFSLQLMKRYAHGHAVALRLGIQLKKLNNRVKLEIKEYNSCCEIKELPYPNQITFDEIKDRNYEVYAYMSIDTKRLLIDLIETQEVSKRK